jgi:hypothetical protein
MDFSLGYFWMPVKAAYGVHSLAARNSATAAASQRVRHLLEMHEAGVSRDRRGVRTVPAIQPGDEDRPCPPA